MGYQFDFSFLTTHWRDIADGVWLILRVAVATIVFWFLLGAVLVVVRTEVLVWRPRAGAESMHKGKEHVEAAFWLALFFRPLRCLVILRQSLERIYPSLIIRPGRKDPFSGSYERSHGPETFTGCCHE